MSESPLPCDNGILPLSQPTDDPTNGNHWARRKLIRQTTLPCPEKLLLNVLLDHLQGKEVCWPSVSTLATCCTLSKRRINQLLAVLTKTGVVITQRRRNNTARRSINWTRLYQEAQLSALPNDQKPQLASPWKRNGVPIGKRSGVRSERTSENTNRKNQGSSADFTIDDSLCDEVMTRWNETAADVGLKTIRKLNNQRRQWLQSRLNDPDWRENWEAALSRLRSAQFALGGGDRGWKLDFDSFIRSDDALTKILEGKYDDAKPKSKRTTSAYEYDPAARQELDF